VSTSSGHERLHKILGVSCCFFLFSAVDDDDFDDVVF
jgi:hypothetical protein